MNHQAMNRWIRAAARGVLGWLVPGGGYLVLHRYRQFALSFALICGAFLAGIALHGGSLWVEPEELQGVDGFTATIGAWEFWRRLR